MNPSLVQAIRERMDGKPTEDLLELWVTNDRVMWSTETFEAVRSLLAERGVQELPPQNEPAALGVRHSPPEVPIDQYWFGWLRPVMWICIVAGAVSLAQCPPLLWILVRNSSGVPLELELDNFILPRVIFEDMFVGCFLELWLVIAAAACLNQRRWARPALLVYAWVAATARLVVGLLSLMDNRPFPASNQEMLVLVGMWLNDMVHWLVLPAVLWVLLRRSEIRGAFEHATVGSGFELDVVGDSRAAPLK